MRRACVPRLAMNMPLCTGHVRMVRHLTVALLARPMSPGTSTVT